MIRSSQVRRVVVPMLMLALLAPAPGMAAAPGDAPMQPADIALSAGGTFRGQVLDRNGQPSRDCEVRISHGSRCVARVRTGQQGEYAVTGLHGGLHAIATHEGATLCRFWAPGSAPPYAAEQLLLIHGDAALRGQRNNRYAIAGMLSNPWLLIAAGAVAIAVPVALNGNGTSGRSGS